MKVFNLIAFSMLLSSSSFAEVCVESDGPGNFIRCQKRTSVNSAEFGHDEKTSNRILKLNYSTGGCNPSSNNPRVEIELVSSTDITPKWALEQDPNTFHEYRLVFQTYILETPSMCRTAYDLDVEADLNKLFEKKTPSLGIDLEAKKAHYSVEFLAPTVRGNTTYSAFR